MILNKCNEEKFWKNLLGIWRPHDLVVLDPQSLWLFQGIQVRKCVVSHYNCVRQQIHSFLAQLQSKSALMAKSSGASRCSPRNMMCAGIGQFSYFNFRIANLKQKKLGKIFFRLFYTLTLGDKNLRHIKFSESLEFWFPEVCVGNILSLTLYSNRYRFKLTVRKFGKCLTIWFIASINHWRRHFRLFRTLW